MFKSICHLKKGNANYLSGSDRVYRFAGVTFSCTSCAFLKNVFMVNANVSIKKHEIFLNIY